MNQPSKIEARTVGLPHKVISFFTGKINGFNKVTFIIKPVKSSVSFDQMSPGIGNPIELPEELAVQIAEQVNEELFCDVTIQIRFFQLFSTSVSFSTFIYVLFPRLLQIALALELKQLISFHFQTNLVNPLEWL